MRKSHKQPEEQPACPSIFDKPDPDRFGEKADRKKPRRGSRALWRTVLALALCVTLVLATSGVVRLIYHKGLFAYVRDALQADDESAVSSAAMEEETNYIFDFSPYRTDPADTDELKLGGVSQIEIQNEADSYTLKSHWEEQTTVDDQTMEEKTAKTLAWLITEVAGRDVAGVRFSSTTVDFIVSDLLHIAYDAVYAEDGLAQIPQGGKTYYEECGLNDTKNSATIRFGSGAAVRVLVGDKTPTGSYRFVAVEAEGEVPGVAAGSHRVYRVDENALVFLLKEVEYFVDLELVHPVEAEESTVDENGDTQEDPYFISGQLSCFDSLSVEEKDGETYTFTMVEEAQPGYDSIYLMTSPLTQNVDLDAIDELLSPMASGLTASRCLAMKATAQDLTRYGLADPVLTVRYEIKHQKTVLKIGKEVSGEEGEGKAYAVMVEGNPTVAAVPAEDLPFYGYTAADYASATVYSCEITKIKTMRVAYAGHGETLFTLTHGTDDEGNATLLVQTDDGKTCSADDFRTFYANMLGLTSFTNVNDGKDAAQPTLSIAITYNDYPQTDVLRLSPYTDRRYFMSLNGMGSTVVLSTQVETVTDSLLALLQ